MAVFGLRASKFPDDLGDGVKDFLDELGLGETDLVRSTGAGRGEVKFDRDAAKMQCK